MTLLRIATFSCADPSSNLGRLDYASLSQQTLMEMLIDGITNRELLCGSKDEPRDLTEWTKLIIDENEEVTRVLWDEAGLIGSISLEWLPSTVEYFGSGANSLDGTVDLLHLPATLIFLNLRGNHFSGSVFLDGLPGAMKQLYLGDNCFDGTVSLVKLPDGLTHLSLDKNRLSGKIDLTHLPGRLQYLFLGKNNFAGETDFSKLPESLKQIVISNTEISGRIRRKRGRKVGYTNSGVEVLSKDF